jgi:hypothetical protein
MTSTAASMLVALGLGFQLVRERAERGRLEQLLAARTAPRIAESAPPGVVAPLPEVVADPDSYLVLTRRLLAGLDDPAPSPERRPEPVPASLEPPLTPLRVRDIDRLQGL